jgi:tetratricopeptide (TPR) repeat protein/transcriptional regulator with XRE-family HTH domain
MEEDEMKPNHRLKHEREQRGWSQAKLAELVGTNPATVGRWERGVSSPYPIHRERLCGLFNKDVQELGLIEEDYSVLEQDMVGVSGSQQGAMPDAKPFIFDPAIPMLPLETATPVGRDEVLTHLKQQLYGEAVAAFSALSGLPGVGKTTLVLALAHDHEIQAHFSDGILWAGLGIQPDIEEIQARWGAQLGLSRAEVTKSKSCNDWAKLLRASIGQRCMLLIIDDVWEIDDALAFQVGGPHCMYLFTTRFPQIATQIAGSRTTAVAELSEENGVDLLAHFVPGLIEQDSPTARRLVNSVGALPLALVLMGRYLRSHTYNEQPRRLHSALRDLSTTEKRMHLSDSHGLSRPYSNYSHRMRYSLQSVIALSDERLDDTQAQSMLRALSLFPPKPNTFSEEAAVAVSKQPAETLDTLCDVGLIESSGPGRYMMHQTIADYARAQMEENPALFERMIAYMTQHMQTHSEDYKAIEQEHMNILAALEEASRRSMDRAFLQGVSAFAPFLRIRGLHDEAKLYLQRGYQITQKLGDYLEEMKLLSHLGQMSERLSEYKEAEYYLSEGLQLARKYEQPEYICLFLAFLGTVMERIGAYQRAETYLQEGLLLARQLDQPERICEVLISLGIVTINQGNYTLAASLLSEALDLARRIEHKEDIMHILAQIGIIAAGKEDYAHARACFLEALDLAYQMGYQDPIINLIINLSHVLGSAREYVQAEQYLQEGLRLSYQTGNLASRAMLLNNLGSIAGKQGRYEQANAYLQEGLNLVRQINQPRIINHMLYELGEVALSAQHYHEAQARFNEALTSATSFPEIRANAHYGLARALAGLGNIDEAYQQGEASTQIFESLELPKATTVKNWLTTLSR